MLIEMLEEDEARVLGTLVEKSLGTPDYYPLTLNALRNACNQKSSRDPVTDYDDEAVSRALAGLKRKCLVAFIPYGSQGTQFKYRHFLEDPRFNLRKPHLAILAVLLLRGGQTLNEVRMRADSLHSLSGLDEAEGLLRELAARPEPLAQLLPKRPGWKEPRWRDTVRIHLDDTENAGMRAESAGTGQDNRLQDPRPHRVPPWSESPAPSLREDVEGLKAEMAALRLAFEALKAEVEKLKADLY